MSGNRLSNCSGVAASAGGADGDSPTAAEEGIPPEPAEAAAADLAPPAPSGEEATIAREPAPIAVPASATVAAKAPASAGSVAYGGNVQCQYKGKGKFVGLWLDLGADGQLAFREKEGGKEMRTVPASGCTVGPLNKPRKGHTFAFRLDLGAADSKGDVKHVISVAGAADVAGWTEALKQANI